MKKRKSVKQRLIEMIFGIITLIIGGVMGGLILDYIRFGYL